MAKQLQDNQLLAEILANREAEIYGTWRNAPTPEKREEAWQALRALDLLAGAIEDGIKRAISGS
jgi:hypothetical protein